MSDFDLVLRGNIVLSDRIIEDGYVAVSGGKVGNAALASGFTTTTCASAWPVAVASRLSGPLVSRNTTRSIRYLELRRSCSAAQGTASSASSADSASRGMVVPLSRSTGRISRSYKYSKSGSATGAARPTPNHT